MDISGSGCEPGPILIDWAASETQYHWISLPNQIYYLLEAIWACQARLTSFWYRKDNVSQEHFFTKKNSKDNALIALQCHPRCKHYMFIVLSTLQCKESMSSINVQCISHICQARPSTCWKWRQRLPTTFLD